MPHTYEVEGEVVPKQCMIGNEVNHVTITESAQLPTALSANLREIKTISYGPFFHSFNISLI